MKSLGNAILFLVMLLSCYSWLVVFDYAWPRGSKTFLQRMRQGFAEEYKMFIPSGRAPEPKGKPAKP